MYKEIDTLIAEAMKSQEKTKLNVFRLIKSEFTNAEKSGITLNNESELKILNKMKKNYEDALSQLTKDSKLAIQYENELAIIKQYLPKEASNEEIAEFTKFIIQENYSSVTMKDMKVILNSVRSVYPTADGKIVSQIVKSFIK